MKTVVPALVSLIVTMGFVVVLWLFLTKPVQLTDNALTVVNVLVGTLAAAFTQVVAYWLGSSAGSARKDEIIAKENGNGQARG
jgi:hypothetical protein